MVNEALAKLLAHNLVVVIHEMYELGIDPTFSATPPADEPRNVLRFRPRASKQSAILSVAQKLLLLHKNSLDLRRSCAKSNNVYLRLTFQL